MENEDRLCDVHMGDIVFRARQTIRSLPPFHGARWNAWLRFACRKAGLDAEEAYLGALPLRNGQSHILQGERVSIRLLLDTKAQMTLPLLLRGLEQTEPAGEFGSHSLLLEQYSVRRLHGGWLEDEIAQAARSRAWRIRLECPLRLPLPHHNRHDQPGKEMYCQADFFAPQGDDGALAHLLRKVRLMDDAAGLAQGLAIAHSGLSWVDIRYNRQRGMAIGGLVGEIVCAGTPDMATARRLVLGQYLGAGKNARFGLGYWGLDVA